MLKIKSTICLNMIVKNETKTLPRLFESLKNIIDTYVIVDTGSTDGTQEYITNYMDELGVPGQLYERPWVNFGVNRQIALDLATGTADYALIIDADEELILSDSSTYKKLNLDCYKVVRKYASVEYELPFLINISDQNKIGWKWNAPVHNYLTSSKVPTQTCISKEDSYVLSHPHQGAKSHGISSKEKYLKDAKLLEAELMRNPSDTRSIFYLAQSYRDANEPDKAIENYLKRAEAGGWTEEVFYSYYQLGLLTLHVKNDVKKAEGYFLDAAKANPRRYAEVAYPLVKHYRAIEDHSSAVFWGWSALPSMKLQEEQLSGSWLFCQKDVYDWRLKDELSLALYYFNAKPISEKLMKELLTEVPPEQKQRIINNIAYF